MTAKRTLFGLLLRALFPRFLFLGHGLMCIWLVTAQVGDDNFWYLAFCLGALVVEGILNVVFRHGREFHWFCPSAFLYLVVLIVSLAILREEQIDCLMNPTTPFSQCMNKKLVGKSFITDAFNKIDSGQRAAVVEQTGLLVLIVGRWLLPQGSISRDQFAQILLIYVGTAADIVEFSEIYGAEYVSKLGKNNKANIGKVLHGVMAVWSWSVLQFSMTIALPEEGLKKTDEEEEEEDDDVTYFRSRMQNKVAPMSYMHYKSMLKQGFENASGTGSLRLKGTEREPSLARQAFLKHKYEITSRSLRERHTANDMYQIGSKTKVKKLSSQSFGSARNSTRVPKSNEIRSPSQSIGSPKSTSSIASSTKSAKVSISSPPPGSLSQGTRKGAKKNSAWKFWESDSTLSITAAEKRRDSSKEDNSLGIKKKDVHNCFVDHLDLFAIALPLVMQDGPFFIYRFVLIVHYEVVTEMIILLSVKNFLVIIVIIYRILIMYCKEPKIDDKDGDDASLRVRNALTTSRKISEQASFRDQRASIAIQAISRMQTQLARRKAEQQNDNWVVDMEGVEATPGQNGHVIEMEGTTKHSKKSIGQVPNGGKVATSPEA